MEGVGGREASVRAAKVKTHLPPNAIQSPERWQDRGGMWGRGYETMIVKNNNNNNNSILGR